MECPFCSYDNLEGVDQCARCQADLTHITGAAEELDIERDLLSRPLSDLLAKDYVVVSPKLSVAETIRKIADDGCHCAIVVDNDAIEGIFTERDVLRKVADQFDAQADRPVAEFMTPNPATLQHDVPVAFALNRMMVGGYRHVPIEQDGTLAGMVSVRDILNYLAKEFSDVITAHSPG